MAHHIMMRVVNHESHNVVMREIEEYSDDGNWTRECIGCFCADDTPCCFCNDEFWH